MLYIIILYAINTECEPVYAFIVNIVSRRENNTSAKIWKDFIKT